MLPECQEILLENSDGVLTLTLNRPHKRNAMNAGLVKEIMSVFESISDDRSIRVVVLRGTGGNFCAGGDISDMNSTECDANGNLISAEQAAWHFSRLFGHMITLVNKAPQVVVTLLEGAVLGGGLGLACISDVAITDKHARFSMPETSLGIIPAQIAPFVVSRIGLTQARRLALLGERIDGEAARELGLAHYLTYSEDEMQAQLEDVLKHVKRCAPEANANTKALMLQVGSVEIEMLLDSAADMFSAALQSSEGQEGTKAFMEKRKPHWTL
ncbi:enoyl-CoA hydratase-related protein [Photobacterium sp. SDRW27]|uniref:enoyl-CoA hydratase/isomerase family protein n=1 Tax=Photobacterium obscurum TaxID=2829490 RepID=UPI002243F961|nr:enoyl-CoA hydratase-related protein [Photobacterium obscurum]MCW8327826.1 enoyl-CoA hydratase-related protein [Photobacterium obscurum]